MIEDYLVPPTIAVALHQAGFNEPCLNNTPLYHQAIGWLFAKGLHIHDVYITPYATGNKKGIWQVRIYDTISGKALWPDQLLLRDELGIYSFNPVPEYLTQQIAWDDAILNAVKMVKHKPYAKN